LSAAKVVVDSREAAAAKNLVAELKGRGIEVEVSKLEAGDYLVTGAEAFLVERSTLPDLARKVMDARLWDQLRAMKAAENVSPLLLVEPSKLRTAMSLDSLYGAMLSAVLDWGVPIIPAFSRAHSAVVLARLHARARLGGGGGARPVFKPRAESPEEEVLRVAASLPGVGPSLAKRLLARFGTLQALANASLDELTEVEGVGEARARRIHEVFRREVRA
jgi:DNA excision repair protein ERCC-4